MDISYVTGPATPSEVNHVGINDGDHAAIVTGLEDDEPIFVLRARDGLAMGAMALWREMAYAQLSDERLESVRVDIDRCFEWRRTHPHLLKDAD